MEYDMFSSINDVKQLWEFLEEKKLTHMKYCHYSSIKNIDKILDSQFFLMSANKTVNDKNESNADNEYYLCFSATDSENIPMWYLYGGVDGKGARITFRNSVIKKWLSDIENKYCFYLVKYKDNSYNTISEIQALDGNNDILSVRFSDVLYLSNYAEDEKLRIKYNNHSNFVFSKSKYDELCQVFKGAYKAIPWFYEKEFRIIISVSDDLSERLINTENVRIAVGFSDEIMSELDLMTGPEQTDKIDVLKYKGFSKFMLSKIQKSRYTNEIEMNLRKRMCEGCEKRK